MTGVPGKKLLSVRHQLAVMELEERSFAPGDTITIDGVHLEKRGTEGPDECQWFICGPTETPLVNL
ncbi:MAG: hypothetical protein WEC84_01175 [Candidatus Andersenbacteria bacterium]